MAPRGESGRFLTMSVLLSHFTVTHAESIFPLPVESVYCLSAKMLSIRVVLGAEIGYLLHFDSFSCLSYRHNKSFCLLPF